jgi:hypothetical protein
MFTFTQSSGPKFTPRWSGTFSGDAKIFMLTIDGDLDGIKRLFADKEASPYDVAISTGRTALHVCLAHSLLAHFEMNADVVGSTQLSTTINIFVSFYSSKMRTAMRSINSKSKHFLSQ